MGGRPWSWEGGARRGRGSGGRQGAVRVRGVRAARAPGRRVNGRESRVCTHAGRACGARGDAQCAEWPGRGRAPGVRCSGRVCVQARRGCAIRAGVQMSGARGARGSPALRGDTAFIRARGAYSPGLRGGAAAPVRVQARAPGSWLPAPAGLPQRARPGAKLGGRRRSHPCSVAPRPPGRSAARAGGSAGPGRQSGAAPQSGHAPRSPSRAPWRSPARSLFNLK